MSRKRSRNSGADRPHGTLLAEEDSFDRRAWLRLGGWSLAATAAVVLAMLANHSSMRIRRDQLASGEIARQAEQMRAIALNSATEAKRLAAAVETLSSDRDRLYSRVSTLEQELDSVTGSIGRQTAAALKPAVAKEETAKAHDAPSAAPALASPPSVVAAADPAITTPASPPMSPGSSMTLPQSTAQEPGNLNAPAETTLSGENKDEPIAPIAVAQTEFGIDLGAADSVEGLRRLWRQISTAHPAMAVLKPRLIIRERAGGVPMQLRLMAGPLRDANAAAQICAALPPAERSCEPAIYDGQRLAMTSDPIPPSTKPMHRRRPKPKQKPTPKPAGAASATVAAPAPISAPGR